MWPSSTIHVVCEPPASSTSSCFKPSEGTYLLQIGFQHPRNRSPEKQSVHTLTHLPNAMGPMIPNTETRTALECLESFSSARNVEVSSLPNPTTTTLVIAHPQQMLNRKRTKPNAPQIPPSREHHTKLSATRHAAPAPQDALHRLPEFTHTCPGRVLPGHTAHTRPAPPSTARPQSFHLHLPRAPRRCPLRRPDQRQARPAHEPAAVVPDAHLHHRRQHREAHGRPEARGKALHHVGPRVRVQRTADQGAWEGKACGKGGRSRGWGSDFRFLVRGGV